MKHFLIFLLFLVLCSFANKIFQKIENGRYIVEIKNRNLINNEDNTTQVKITYEIFVIQINDTSYTKFYQNGDTVFGNIEYINENVFIMRDINPEIDTTEVGKLILKSFGEPCIEIFKEHDDTFFFEQGIYKICE